MLKLVALFALVLCATLVASSLVGGYIDRAVDDDDVATAASFAARALGQKFNTAYHVKLTHIKKAQSQVVAGVNYRLNVIVGLTTCKKAEVDYNEIDKCDYQDNVSTYRKCEVVIYRDLKNNHRLISSGCILAGRDEVY